MNIKNIGNLAASILIIGFAAFSCQPSAISWAEPIQPSQIEFAIAKGCHLYDSGKLKEALREFQSILKEDPANQTAAGYANKIWLRLNATAVSSWELSEEMIGYKNALIARKKIEVTDQEKYVSHAKDQPYERFINNTTFGYNDRQFEASTDRSFSADGFFIAERLRMDGVFQDNWRNTFSLDARHHDNGYEDTRVRRLTYAISNPGGLRFIAGDTSTQLSRYTLRGLYYRGANLSVDNDKNEFKILLGATPHLLTRTQGGQNIDSGYIHPRRVFAVRDAYKPNDSYKIGVSFMELRDSERIRVIDTNYNPKLNRVVAIDQKIEPVPNKWKIKTESAYAASDEDRTDKAILVKDEKLKDFAHYIESAIEIQRFRLVNSFERVGSDFRSYADLASTNATWLSSITADREKIDNYLEYRPFDFDPLYLDLQLSRVRNNLDKDNDVEMNQQTNYEAGLRFVPEEYEWLPQAGVRLKFLNTLNIPGSQYASGDVSDRDILFELAKRLYGIDLNTSYTNRKTLDNIETFGSYANIYNVRFAKELTDMVLLSGNWYHSNTQKNQNGNEGTIGRENFFNINTALRLWAGANLSFGYGYENDIDSTGILGDTKINTYSTTFSWPFSKYFLANGAELSLAPYITYQLADGKGGGNKERSVWTASMDGTYQIARDHRISVSTLYREDQDNNSASAGTEDKRVLLTYQKIFQ